MSAEENKRKHLDFIQLTITRMAANSFLLKAWSITLVAAILALLAKDKVKTYILIAYIPVLSFWVLDAYYLCQERLFRALYDKVRLTEATQIDFSMKTTRLQGANWGKCMFSATLAWFYIPIVIVLVVVSFLLIIRS